MASVARHTALAALLFALAAAPATAQDDTAPAGDDPAAATTEAPAEEAPADAGDAPSALEGGLEAAPAGPAAGTAEEALQIETFEDWELRCEPEGGQCFMYQLLRDGNGNPVSEFTIVGLPEEAEAAAGVTVITPLGTLLDRGVVLQIDDGEARQYQFNWCTEVGCFARFGLTDAQIAAMRAGRVARVRILSVVDPERPVVLEMSLSGFTAAHDALKAQ